MSGAHAAPSMFNKMMFRWTGWKTGFANWMHRVIDNDSTYDYDGMCDEYEDDSDEDELRAESHLNYLRPDGLSVFDQQKINDYDKKVESEPDYVRPYILTLDERKERIRQNITRHNERVVDTDELEIDPVILQRTLDGLRALDSRVPVGSTG